MGNFLERIQSQPLLGDGAMGTLLYGRGVGVEQCLEALVVERPELISSIHEEYARAGADLFTTHTFGANRMRLAFQGLEERVRDFNLAAVRLAQDVRAKVGRDLLIAGNVGPVGKRVAWENGAEETAVAAAFHEQIAALVEAGVDLLLFETFSDVAELEVAVRVARQLCALPVVASMSYGADGLTLAGQGVGEVTPRLLAAGADLIGANCSVGPQPMVETLRVMRGLAPASPLSVAPNAGLPVQGEGGELSYPFDPANFALFVPRYLALGARLIGGCCGTTPDHIAAMAAVVGV
jgi:homocysteine S-methyltransferase